MYNNFYRVTYVLGYLVDTVLVMNYNQRFCEAKIKHSISTQRI